MNDKFFLTGDEGEIEGERFGDVWRIWEYESDNLQDNLEVPNQEILGFINYWKRHGYPHLETIHGVTLSAD